MLLLLLLTVAVAAAAALGGAPEPGSGPGPAAVLGAGADLNSSNSIRAGQCAMSYAGARRVALGAWERLLDVLGDQVELLAFEDTILQRLSHPSPRRTLRPLHLLEGTEVTGIRNGEVTLHAVHEDNATVIFSVRLKPLKIRGALRSGEETHLLRGFLVDTTFRFRTLAASGDTVYALGRAGHVAGVQVANGDRTDTAYAMEIEALLAGAAVTSIVHEVQRAAHVFPNWARERAKHLEWTEQQVPRSWSDYGRDRGPL